MQEGDGAQSKTERLAVSWDGRNGRLRWAAARRWRRRSARLRCGCVETKGESEKWAKTWTRCGRSRGRVGRGGHRTPPGRCRRHALATRRGEPDTVGRVRPRGRRRCAWRGPGVISSLGIHGPGPLESQSLILIINDTKLLILLYQMKWARHKQHVIEVEMAWRDGHKTTWFGVWNDEQDHEEMHIKWWTWWSSEGEGSKSARQRYNHRVFFCRSKMSREVIDRA
jgi:hypothetical protein